MQSIRFSDIISGLLENAYCSRRVAMYVQQHSWMHIDLDVYMIGGLYLNIGGNLQT